MNTSTITDTTPRVWVGCLACYNGMRLVGDWFDAIDAADVTPERIHGHLTEHEEMWCFDHENIPASGEFDPGTATAWAEALEQVDDDERDAYIAYAKNLNATTPSEFAELADSFSDHYSGEWDTVREYAEEYAESTGMLREMPEHLLTYFDWDAYARDIENESTVLEAPGGRVFIFSE